MTRDLFFTPWLVVAGITGAFFISVILLNQLGG